MEGCPFAKGLKFKCFTSPSPEQTHRSSSAAAKSQLGTTMEDQDPSLDSLEKRDLSDPHEICYATINHTVKQKPTMTNSNHETEYAFVNMPAKKGTSTSHQNMKQKPNTTNSSHETEYAFVNMPAKKGTSTSHHNMKQKPNTTNSSHETEYAFVNMPAKKGTSTSHQNMKQKPNTTNSSHETEYAFFMPAEKVTSTIHQDNEYDYVLIS
nr:uncharacterized protein LOC102460803 isoform X2 [Pelodiscus sinensis]|eukprot:XP_006116885.1 uncharacterized protein LOC102460803 isoform X2 [Pelodiscus sinensis]